VALRPAPLCALLVLVASGCAHARGTPSAEHEVETVRVGDAIFLLDYQREDAGTARQVKGALGRAVPTAARWGRLSVPVRITIHPTHQALELATHREGQAWLRGWARFASVDLQSPRTWSSGAASDAQMFQILAHEITHCVMYQSAARESTWQKLPIPLWFKEGMASVTAGQDHKRSLSEAIWRLYKAKAAADGPRSTADPLTEAGPRFDSELVYGTAHLAFSFLLERYGDESVRKVIARMGGGGGFPEAFQEATGIAVDDFQSEFRRHVVGEG
jgi:hypothetical protein